MLLRFLIEKQVFEQIVGVYLGEYLFLILEFFYFFLQKIQILRLNWYT